MHERDKPTIAPIANFSRRIRAPSRSEAKKNGDF